jgi:uncharacterized protein YxeA
MKNIAKHVLPLLSLVMLAGCSGNNSGTKEKGTLVAPTDFTVDFETSTYSFKGSENATFYTIKVYEKEGNDYSSHALASSGMIKAQEESNEYTGTIDYEFTAGDYKAEITAIAPRYSLAKAETTGKSTMLATPEVTAEWNDPNASSGSGEFGIDLNISSSDSYTQSYTVKVICTDNQKVVYENDAYAEKGNFRLTQDKFTCNDWATISGYDQMFDYDYSVTVKTNDVSGYKVHDAMEYAVAYSDTSVYFKPFTFEKGADSVLVDFGKATTLQNMTAYSSPVSSTEDEYLFFVNQEAGSYNVKATFELKKDNTATMVVDDLSSSLEGGTYTSTWSETEDGKISVGRLEKESDPAPQGRGGQPNP